MRIVGAYAKPDATDDDAPSTFGQAAQSVRAGFDDEQLFRAAIECELGLEHIMQPVETGFLDTAISTGRLLQLAKKAEWRVPNARKRGEGEDDTLRFGTVLRECTRNDRWLCRIALCDSDSWNRNTFLCGPSLELREPSNRISGDKVDASHWHANLLKC